MENLGKTNGAIGGGRLRVAPDIDLLDPCAVPAPAGEQCAGAVCNTELGEVHTNFNEFLQEFFRFVLLAHFAVVQMAKSGQLQRTIVAPWNPS